MLRFPYYSNRESYEINRLVGIKLVQPYTNIGKRPDPKICNNGDWWNDKDNKYFYLCMSGKNTKTAEFIDINAVICSASTCNGGVATLPKEATFRKWSDPANWPN